MSSYENFSKVRDAIDARREAARRAADLRCEELRTKSAEIAEIDAELSKTGPLIFKTACEGGDIAPLKKRNQELNFRRKDIIESLGYPRDYTEVKYSCPLCNDTGFIDIKMCTCFKRLLTEENIKSSGMGRLLEEQSFENFNISHYADNEESYRRMEGNLKAAKAYAASFGRGSRARNLLLMGKTGTGKTHISTSIAKVVIEMGYDVLYESTQNIVAAFENDRFRSGYGPSESQSDKYLSCDLLILDDLGTEFANQFTVSCLYNLFNTRRNRGLATIVSTNLTADELVTKYDDRIYSRIVGSDYTVLFFEGKDHRLFPS